MHLPQPVRILSDLHLAHPACAVRSVAQLEPLLEGAGTVIFNGDTVELELAETKIAARRSLAGIEELARRLGFRPLFINGNHDPRISNVDFIELAGGRAIALHGHMLFPEIAPWGRDASRLRRAHLAAIRDQCRNGDSDMRALHEAARHACLSIVTDNNKHATLLRWARNLVVETGNPWRFPRLLRAWATAPSRAANLIERHAPRADLICIGHTHFAGQWRRGRRTVVNTGGYLPGPGRSIVEIDGNTAIVRPVRSKGKLFIPSSRRAREIDLRG